jgi:uncharacterized protein YraI
VKRHLIIIVVIAILSAVGVAATHAQTGGYGNPCYGAAPPRLQAGGQGRVTPGLPNVLRTQPWQGSGSYVIGEIPAGGVFSILEPYAAQCSNDIRWYFVNYNGIAGWTPEAAPGGPYWTEPATSPPVGCGVTPRLQIGGQGVVTPGLPNVIRNQPWRGGGSYVVGNIPAGGLFAVLNGPQCANGILWWQVNYNGVIGWTGEGEGYTYWTAPATGTGVCNPLPPRLTVGSNGYVLPGLPNRLRSAPGLSSPQIGRIPANAWFSVIGGPTCVENTNWWQVNYRGIVGWTAESSGYAYWIAPAY